MSTTVSHINNSDTKLTLATSSDRSTSPSFEMSLGKMRPSEILAPSKGRKKKHQDRAGRL